MIGAMAAGGVFWLLMTSDLSLINVAIGLSGSAAISRLVDPAIPLRKLLKTVLKVLFFTLPLAFLQAIWLVLVPHPVEETKWETITEGSSDAWDILSRVFGITLTPLTLALDTDDRGRIKVHFVKRRKRRRK